MMLIRMIFTFSVYGICSLFILIPEVLALSRVGVENPLSTSQPFDQENTQDIQEFSIAGMLVDTSGNPVKGEKVYIFSMRDGQIMVLMKFDEKLKGHVPGDLFGITDENGRFEIKFDNEFLMEREKLSEYFTLGVFVNFNNPETIVNEQGAGALFRLREMVESNQATSDMGTFTLKSK